MIYLAQSGLNLNKNNFQTILNTIPKHVQLVTVTKYLNFEQTQQLIDCGAITLGESRVQLAREKFSQIDNSQVHWHLIGPLQKNKVKFAVKIFDLIQSVDSYNLAKEISLQSKKINKQQEILLQVNIGLEAQKHGVSPQETWSILEEISNLENIKVRGLMTIPPLSENPQDSRSYFQQMKQIFDTASKKIANADFDILSMGMSADYQIAIEEGSTMVRIGSLICNPDLKF